MAGQKKKEKNREKRIGTGPDIWEGAVKEEEFPHTRGPLQWWGWRVAGGKLWSHGGEYSNRGAESKAERFPHRGSVLTSTHEPEMLIC